MLGSAKDDYITAVGKLEDRLLILLDLERIMSTKEREEGVTLAA